VAAVESWRGCDTLSTVDHPLRLLVVGRTAEELTRLRERLARHGGLRVGGEVLLSALQSGATDVSPEIDAVLIPPEALVPPAANPRTVPGSEPLVEQLTPRERDVLALVADGLGNRAIAHALAISEHTVKFHLASVFGKLGVSSRTEAARRGLRLGLIDI
jgi:DNA-binding NarL/FixJ family response regulator